MLRAKWRKDSLLRETLRIANWPTQVLSLLSEMDSRVSGLVFAPDLC